MAQLNDVNAYIDEWTRVQLEIWREKVERLKVVYTGHLHQSFSQAIQHTSEGSTVIMKFARYGVYQAYGTGRGYTHGNGGDLEFLGKDYRREHGLDKPKKVGPAWGGYLTSGKPREQRDWMNKKLYMSVMAMVEDLARITGEEAARVMCDALTDPRAALR